MLSEKGRVVLGGRRKEFQPGGETRGFCLDVAVLEESAAREDKTPLLLGNKSSKKKKGGGNYRERRSSL